MDKREQYALYMVLGLAMLVFAFLLLGGLLYPSGAHLLEPQKIPETFQRLAGWSLPERADHLRAIRWRRHSAIFITFQTDHKGVEYVINQCKGPEEETMSVDPNIAEELRGSGAMLFYAVQMAQENLGVRLFDMHMFESGRWLRNSQLRGSMRVMYEFFIDDRNNTVYLQVNRSRDGRRINTAE